MSFTITLYCLLLGLASGSQPRPPASESLAVTAAASFIQLSTVRQKPPAIGLLYTMAGQEPSNLTATAEQLKAWQAYEPCARCKQPVRIGEDHDGGYIMCGELFNDKTKAVYSYGINGFDGWGAQISKRSGGAVVEQYDCFNLERPKCPAGMSCNFNFHGECVAPSDHEEKGKKFGSLRQQLLKDGHLPMSGDQAVNLVMKMDIEGAEWPILADEGNKELLKHFSQIVLEFHNAQEVIEVKTKALKNLLELFEVVHVHANNCCTEEMTADGYVVPKYLEVTFVRKGLVEKSQCQGSPAESSLDRKNIEQNPQPAQMKLGPN